MEVTLMNCGDDRLLEVEFDLGQKALSDVRVTASLFYLGHRNVFLFILGQFYLRLFLNPLTI